MTNLVFIKPKHGSMVPMPLYLCPPGRPDMLVPPEGISVRGCLLVEANAG